MQEAHVKHNRSLRSRSKQSQPLECLQHSTEFGLERSLTPDILLVSALDVLVDHDQRVLALHQLVQGPHQPRFAVLQPPCSICVLGAALRTQLGQITLSYLLEVHTLLKFIRI